MEGVQERCARALRHNEGPPDSGAPCGALCYKHCLIAQCKPRANASATQPLRAALAGHTWPWEGGPHCWWPPESAVGANLSQDAHWGQSITGVEIIALSMQRGMAKFSLCAKMEWSIANRLFAGKKKHSFLHPISHDT